MAAICKVGHGKDGQVLGQQRSEGEAEIRPYEVRVFQKGKKLWEENFPLLSWIENFLSSMETSLFLSKVSSWRWMDLLFSSSRKKTAVAAIALTRTGRHARARTPRDKSSSSSSEQDAPIFSIQDEECVEPFPGIVFDVYHLHTDSPETCRSSSRQDEDYFQVRYQLFEPMHLKLGSTVKHVTDFAYMPVLTDQVVPVVAHQQSQYSPARVSRTDGRRGNWEDIAGLLDTHQGHDWWQWWIPWWSWDGSQDHFSNYRMNNFAFAGGSHGEVWKGRRRCTRNLEQQDEWCSETLIFKRLKIENGYRVLEAGLREVYFGKWISDQVWAGSNDLYTRYLDHFFREQKNALELWIVFENAGPSLRSFLYSGTLYGDFIVYQHSLLWTKLRASLSTAQSNSLSSIVPRDANTAFTEEAVPGVGKFFVREVLRQIIEAGAYLHANGIVHRDIKPSNILCKTNLEWDDRQVKIPDLPLVKCVLGDFSSAWNTFVGENLYTGGPSRLEQTDEYAPPEALFGNYISPWLLGPTFDSWSIGIVALELLLGTPNVFTVDQRTKAVLTHKMQKQGASNEEIDRALYLAALSQFCIYDQKPGEWPLRHGDPLYKLRMVKQSCTINDFKRALHARDPLGIGFDASDDSLLHLIWQLLAWDPKDRMTASAALRHPYFNHLDVFSQQTVVAGEHNALESQMLDPRMDMKMDDEVDTFICPKCGRRSKDWHSCLQHSRARKHANFCTYETKSLPTCLNAHSMLPTHSASGHCDIRGRRTVIEDFHAIHLLPDQQFYGIFDGHNGNRASKYVTSFLFESWKKRLDNNLDSNWSKRENWVSSAIQQTAAAFHDVHNDFLNAASGGLMTDGSGTTATVMLVRNKYVIVASLGDSRAVLSAQSHGKLSGIQLTKDHVASDPEERKLVEERGGIVQVRNGVARVNGTLAITRSLGDAGLARHLSQTPDVFPFEKHELLERCGELKENPNLPCFVILASDGLWDVVDNDDAVMMVAEIVQSMSNQSPWQENSSWQQAAEALVREAYVRGSSDNIGVCVVALTW